MSVAGEHLGKLRSRNRNKKQTKKKTCATPQVTQTQQHEQFKPTFTTPFTIVQAEAVIISDISKQLLLRVW